MWAAVLRYATATYQLSLTRSWLAAILMPLVLQREGQTTQQERFTSWNLSVKVLWRLLGFSVLFMLFTFSCFTILLHVNMALPLHNTK